MMSSTKVGLVQINNSFADSCYFPLSVGLLQSYFNKYGHKPENFEFIEPIYRRQPIEEAVEHLRNVQIVGFSCYVWNEKISLAIAKKLKEANPEVLIIFGGPQVPDKAGPYLRDNPFVDILCHGEGESVFLKILENFHSRNYDEIPSISYLNKGNLVQHPRIQRIKNLSSIPSPYLEGVFDGLLKKTGKQKWLGLWETNRGCPFSCCYCDWGSAIHQRLYKFDMDRIEREAEWFSKNKVEFIFCCDANFGIIKRDLDIVKIVIDKRKKYGFPEALSVQNTKNATERSYAVQKMLSEAGLSKGVTMALQTVDRTTLKNVGRHNISLKSFEVLQKRFNNDGIVTYTDLILGLPGETYDSFTDGVDKTIDNGQYNRIQFINLSVLPNAKMGDPEYQQKYGLSIVDTKIVNIHGSLAGAEDEIEETQRLVVGTNTMPKSDWVKARIFSWMISLLFFDKLMQIPIFLLHKISDYRYRDLIEIFMTADKKKFPILFDICDFFSKEAKNLQEGGLEYCKSPDWLNIYWPHDEYIFIKVCVEKKLDRFYEEAERLFRDMFRQEGKNAPSFLGDAIYLNKNLVKKPFQKDDMNLHLNHNIWEYYKSAFISKEGELKQGNFKYYVNRTQDVWNTWDDWFREVVWYGNKKGAYLYNIISV